jgi:hypothetical protein
LKFGQVEVRFEIEQPPETTMNAADAEPAPTEKYTVGEFTFLTKPDQTIAGRDAHADNPGESQPVKSGMSSAAVTDIEIPATEPAIEIEADTSDDQAKPE